jgi:type IV pilus assembly protein PilE
MRDTDSPRCPAAPSVVAVDGTAGPRLRRYVGFGIVSGMRTFAGAPTRGFTLMELALVLLLIGLLASLTAPSFGRMVLRGRTLEARVMLDAIDAAERAYFRDHGRYVACAPSTDAVPRGVRAPFDHSRAGWRELGVRSEGATRYRYEVRLQEGGFVALAEGDLDGDGKSSLFTLDGRTHKLAVENELE